MFSQHTDTVIRARHFTNASRGPADIDRIVMHTTEGKPERPDFAEDVANFFKNIPAKRRPKRPTGMLIQKIHRQSWYSER